MAESPEALLATIPKLAEARDASALAALETHADKAVRKAARKALHVLRTKGVDVPPTTSRAWQAGNVDDLRGQLEPYAIVDSRSLPGAVRIAVSVPRPEADCLLMIGTLGPDDRVLEFGAFNQTDGQRARSLKHWERRFGDRTIPPAWALSRLRWARERSVASGHSVPADMDAVLPELGDAPERRPETFVRALLASEAASQDSFSAILSAAGAVRWPILIDVEGLTDRVGRMMAPASEGEAPKEMTTAMVAEAARGDLSLRAGLTGPVLAALEDAATGLWVEGRTSEAKRLLEVIERLATSSDPETDEDALELLRLQMMTLAVRVLSQQQQRD